MAELFFMSRPLPFPLFLLWLDLGLEEPALKFCEIPPVLAVLAVAVSVLTLLQDSALVEELLFFETAPEPES